MRIGSLFSGAGGLDLGVRSVIGGELAFVAETDAAARRVLAQRCPDVPNLGDVSLIDWEHLKSRPGGFDDNPIDVLTGGFPCQDVSLAGHRKGLREGTRSGLWSHMARAIEALNPRLVVIENVSGIRAASAAGAMVGCPFCLGNGTDAVLRALGAVLGDLAVLGFDAEWMSVRASDVGAPHRRERVFIAAYRDSELLYRGLAAGTGGWAESANSDPRPPPAMTLLPIPCANPSGGTPEQHLARKPGRTQVTDLSIMVKYLLPTPTARDMKEIALGIGPGCHDSLPRAIHLLLTPQAHDKHGPKTQEQIAAGRANGAGVRNLNETVVHEDFGPYQPAIKRWERITGWPAPPPTEKGVKRPRLSAHFVEWMMGLPESWVTGVKGVAFTQQLKILGNGVVPQQAAHALELLLAQARRPV